MSDIIDQLVAEMQHITPGAWYYCEDMDSGHIGIMSENAIDPEGNEWVNYIVGDGEGHGSNVPGFTRPADALFVCNLVNKYLPILLMIAEEYEKNV